MSFNRYEQFLYDYIDRNDEEKRFWEGRVVEIGSQGGRLEELVLGLNDQLWDYFEERARFDPVLRDLRFHDGEPKISMLNLSEYLLRMWVQLPKKKARRQLGG